MKAGTVFRSFVAKDGRAVVLRAPRWSDLDDMLEFINSLVDEGVDIAVDKKVTREEEVDWLARHMTAIEKDEEIVVAAEVDGRFVGQVEVIPKRGRLRHVGVLGISLRNGFRDVGIGTELMQEAETQTKRLGLELLTLEVFASNSRARHLYEKVGYRIVGCVPRAVRKDGEYVDSIMMAKEI